MLKSNPAENLLNASRLDDGWQVVAKVPKSSAATGGNFSVGYIATHKSGKRAFLKALDFSEALRQPNTTIVLQSLTSTYNYEKMLLDQCRAANLDRVAVTIADGEIPVGVLDQTLPVPYLIFDLAEGDIRTRLDLSKRFDLAFCLRALHQCTTGIQQLHSIKVAHQDLKPSNVLVFDDADARITDLGRSALQGMKSPIENEFIPGDKTYAPPELLYSNVSTDWRIRRLACDLYQVGSLAVFFFTKISFTAMWLHLLDQQFWPKNWGQSYYDALPYIRNAHDLAYREFEKQVPIEIRVDLTEAVRQLCDPDPVLRGHPSNRGSNRKPYSLERYISRFDYLARIAEWRMRKTKI